VEISTNSYLLFVCVNDHCAMIVVKSVFVLYFLASVFTNYGKKDNTSLVIISIVESFDDDTSASRTIVSIVPRLCLLLRCLWS
jgi:predicted membrane protein